MAENAEILKEMSDMKDNVAAKSLTTEGIQCFNLDMLDLDLEDIESIEIGTSKGVEKIKASDFMAVLNTHTTATDLSETQNKDSDILMKKSEASEILDMNLESFANNSNSDQLTELFKDFYSTVKTSGWLEENTVNKVKSENPELFAGVMEIKDKRALGMEDNSAPEEFEILPQNSTTKNEDHALMDVMTQLHQQIKSSNWLEEQNKALANKPKTTADTQGNIKLEVDKNVHLADGLEILSNSGKSDHLTELFKDFYSTVKTSGWLEENTVDKMKSENPELFAGVMEIKEKKALGIDDNSIPEEFEIIPQNPTTNNNDHELMDVMTELHQQIKSSNWLEEQNKALAYKPKTTADSQENGNSSELENMMLHHMHTIKTTDWMAVNNPEVTTELVEVTEQKQNLCDKIIPGDRR